MKIRIIVLAILSRGLEILTDENRTKFQTEVPEIFAEDLRSDSTTKQGRIIGRKGANFIVNTTQSVYDNREDSLSVPNDGQKYSTLKHIVFASNTPSAEDDSLTPSISANTDGRNDRRKYIVISLILALLLALISLGRVIYRRIKNWIEVRHYQKVVSIPSYLIICYFYHYFSVGLSCRGNVYLLSSLIITTIFRNMP